MTDKNKSSAQQVTVGQASGGKRDLWGRSAAIPDAEIMHLSRLVTIGELSACFAHDVYNPLMVIRGHLKLINEGISPDNPVRDNLDVIQRASKRIEEMADRMLDFSRKRAPQTELCDCCELVEDALRFMQPYLRERHIAVNVECDPELPRVRIDRWQMIQAFVNLLQNAAEAMANSERKLLRVAVMHEKAVIRISVSDTGHGIAAADLPRLFNPFFTTKGDTGTGLGLYIAKRVIEEHNGTIAVQTNRKGTTFTIGFPQPR
jgi:two-component system NtrC family sensor kinase